MATKPFIAEKGLITQITGSSASLAVAAPLEDGLRDAEALTDSTRMGWYWDRTSEAQRIGYVVNGVATVAITTFGLHFPNLTPAAPADGDFWYTTAGGFQLRHGGTTAQFIGGSLASTQVAVGAATANVVQGSANLTYANGKLVSSANDATYANLNIGVHSAAPATLTNGDVWSTSAGVFARVNGGTVGPFGGPLSAGFLNSVAPTDNGDGTIALPSQTVNLYTAADFQGRPLSYTLPAIASMSLTDNAVNYVVANYNSGSPIYTVGTTLPASSVWGLTTPYYIVYRSGTVLTMLSWDSAGAGLADRLNYRNIRTQRFAYESGLMLTELATRVVSIPDGIMWNGAARNELSAFASNTGAWHFWYHVGGVWTESLATTQYNNTQYDNGTDLATLTNNRYTVNWIYRSQSPSASAFYVLGTGDFNTLTLAAASLPPANLPSEITSFGFLVGRIIVLKGASTAAQIDSAFTRTFVATPITDHNSLADLQGGTASEYYHLTSTQYSNLGTVTSVGITSTDLSVSDSPVTGAGNITLNIGTNAVTNSKLAQIATATFKARATTGVGNVEDLSVAQVKTLLSLTGTNSGDQTITLTSDVTGSGTSSFATTISAGAVTLAKMANLAANSIIGNNTGSPATPIALSVSQTTAMLDTFTTLLKGLAPASGGGTTNFLRADGTWTAPAGTFSGSIAANQIAYGSGTNTIQGSAGFTYTGSLLTVNTTGVASIVAPSGTTMQVVSGSGNGAVTRIMQDCFMGTGGGYNTYLGRAARGTISSPSALQAGDEMTRFGARGYGATAFSSANRAYVSMWAAENWTDSAQGTRVGIFTTAPGTTTTTEKFRFWGDGGVSVGTNLAASPGAGVLMITGTGTYAVLPNLKLQAFDTLDTYMQSNMQNLSNGTSASSDWVATADNGTDSANFVDMGINGSGWSSGTWTLNGADDAYVYSGTTNFAIGTGGTGKTLRLFTGGTLAANARLDLTDTAITAYNQIITPATTTAAASLRLPHGTAPTSPVNGDLWTTSANVYARVNGATYTLINSLMLFSQTQTVTFSGTATTTMIGTGVGSVTVPANSLTAGKKIRVKALFTSTRPSSSYTLVVIVTFGTYTATLTQTSLSGTNSHIFDAEFVPQAAGASVTIVGTARLESSASGMQHTVGTAAAFDTTAATTLSLTGSVNQAAASLSCYSIVVESLFF